ncbi:NADPH-dependent aldehyde reductase ARI1-like isoform X1 [Brachionus plicatilis]|uniref:NADPH-dependent aldehyde reductase ARI1-like isoform X1 n=1 Tax=Brachionus plicatilis TaxID=10195 RepID=A0A3M7RHF9_BRAPC|nr:NADPH-dependent aldehyde reductase ARI1-like isoform X1 [Brachionus plicatilis]
MNPEADSQRHIIVSTVENTSMKDWALILDQEFSSKGYNVPTKVAPNFMVKFMSLFDAQINLVKKMLGIKSSFSNSRMINALKVEPIALKSTIIDMAYKTNIKKIQVIQNTAVRSILKLKYDTPSNIMHQEAFKKLKLLTTSNRLFQLNKTIYYLNTNHL